MCQCMTLYIRTGDDPDELEVYGTDEDIATGPLVTSYKFKVIQNSSELASWCVRVSFSSEV